MSLKYVLITPAYNEDEYIEKTIQSVITQTVLPAEWVIISDGSTDKTNEIISNYIGEYKWITEVQDYSINNIKQIQNELMYQYNIGILPENKSKTQILLHIDKFAPWEQIAKLIFAIRELGFEAHPIYEPENK